MASVLQNILSLFKGPLILYNYIKNGYINIPKAEEIQEKFKSDLNEITKEKSKRKSEEIRRAKKCNKRYKKALRRTGKSFYILQ